VQALLACEPLAGRHTIEGRIASEQVADLLWSRIDATSQRVDRTRELIARGDGDHDVVSILNAGHCVASQDGRQSEMAPGDFVLLDAGKPYRLDYSGDFSVYALMIPGPVLRQVLRPERLAVVAQAGGGAARPGRPAAAQAQHRRGGVCQRLQ